MPLLLSPNLALTLFIASMLMSWRINFVPLDRSPSIKTEVPTPGRNIVEFSHPGMQFSNSNDLDASFSCHPNFESSVPAKILSQCLLFDLIVFSLSLYGNNVINRSDKDH